MAVLKFLSYARLVGRSCIFNSDVHTAFKMWYARNIIRFNTCRCIMTADGVIKFTTSDRVNKLHINDSWSNFELKTTLHKLIDVIPNTKQIRLSPHHVEFSQLQLLIERLSNFKKHQTAANVFALIEVCLNKELTELSIKILPNYRIEGTKSDFFNEIGVRGVVLHYATARSTEFTINKTLFNKSYIRPVGIKKNSSSSKSQAEIINLSFKDTLATDFLNIIKPEISSNAYELLQQWVSDRNIT